MSSALRDSEEEGRSGLPRAQPFASWQDDATNCCPSSALRCGARNKKEEASCRELGLSGVGNTTLRTCCSSASLRCGGRKKKEEASCCELGLPRVGKTTLRTCCSRHLGGAWTHKLLTTASEELFAFEELVLVRSAGEISFPENRLR